MMNGTSRLIISWLGIAVLAAIAPAAEGQVIFVKEFNIPAYTPPKRQWRL